MSHPVKPPHSRYLLNKVTPQKLCSIIASIPKQSNTLDYYVIIFKRLVFEEACVNGMIPSSESYISDISNSQQCPICYLYVPEQWKIYTTYVITKTGLMVSFINCHNKRGDVKVISFADMEELSKCSNLNIIKEAETIIIRVLKRLLKGRKLDQIAEYPPWWNEYILSNNLKKLEI